MLGYKPGSKGIQIEKLGAKRGDQFIDGVCVVWIARDPRTNKTAIVGWYKAARLFRQPQTPTGKSRRMLAGTAASYIAEANASNCECLHSDSRSFPIPSRNEVAGGFGQSPVWYGLNDQFRKRVIDYIDKPKIRHRATLKKPGRIQDVELRQKIERIAIQHAADFYESDEGGAYLVNSVEKDAKGWDLEATRGSEVLRIEVKGKGSNDVCAELTPNEFKKMKAHRDSYVIYIVTSCLDKKPSSHIFRYMHDSKKWEAEDGRVLEIEEKVAAVVGCK